MQICKVSVRVRCSANHVITNKEVTVPEIRILQSIHGGKEAVQDIVPVRFDRNFNHEEERQRLRKTYERGAGNADEVHGLVAKMFGPLGPLPTTLQAIGLDPRAIALKKRREAEEMLAAANKLEEQASGDKDLNDFEREALAAMEARENDETDEDATGIDETERDLIDPPPANIGNAVADALM